MTPDISAETWLGAAGCARGSHTCSGITPALDAKPRPSRSSGRTRAPGVRSGAALAQSANVALPVAAVSRSMPASRQARPAWLMTAYSHAASTDSGSSRSWSTRK